MVIFKNLIVIPLLILATQVLAQSKYNDTSDSRTVTVSITSVTSSLSRERKKYSYDIYYDRLIEEYRERMISNVKKHKRIARKMKKPQYSDPSYFGHKHKPKKRAVGKRKLCKECLIVH